ncbi:NAD(P)H-quinone oxidoreductase subunit L, chloroplastic [Neltuma alba]|uniref:NAD(P)H-quinone oxidoreductase subunit L, chloroplastic n=1 Tax=Neltuma alba TaxID=207710 RepID=UPI0010A4418F|nr:NAD(P)H-quinone oxidoreductase subunit L, chloroplastic-like [Prosopis alba]
MSCSFNLHFPKALPPLFSCSRRCGTAPSFFVASQHKPSSHTTTPSQKAYSSLKPNESISLQKPSLALQIGALLAFAEQPAFAVTGVNNEPELSWVLIQLAIVLFGYFIVMPPIILNWLRIRWYRRNLLELYVQFMFVFIFFPGVLLWAPFLNFRKFPRDPSLKYPWSTPEDPSKIRNAYPKYPFAKPEDYP